VCVNYLCVFMERERDDPDGEEGGQASSLTYCKFIRVSVDWWWYAISFSVLLLMKP
jgi:hypothetical protein